MTDENDESRGRREPPRPTQECRSFAQIIKQQFRAVAKAIIQTLAPSPTLRRKRREETGKAFRLTARRRLSRRPPPRMDYEPPTFLLPPEMLDWMNPDYNDAGEAAADEDYQPQAADYPFPQP